MCWTHDKYSFSHDQFSFIRKKKKKTHLRTSCVNGETVIFFIVVVVIVKFEDSFIVLTINGPRAICKFFNIHIYIQ